MNLAAPLAVRMPGIAAPEYGAARRFARALCRNELFRRAAMRVLESRLRASSTSAGARHTSDEEALVVALGLLHAIERALADGNARDALWFALALALPRRVDERLRLGCSGGGRREGGRERS